MNLLTFLVIGTILFANSANSLNAALNIANLMNFGISNRILTAAYFFAVAAIICLWPLFTIYNVYSSIRQGVFIVNPPPEPQSDIIRGQIINTVDNINKLIQDCEKLSKQK